VRHGVEDPQQGCAGPEWPRQGRLVCRSASADSNQADQTPARAAAGVAGHFAGREQTTAAHDSGQDERYVWPGVREISDLRLQIAEIEKVSAVPIHLQSEIFNLQFQ